MSSDEAREGADHDVVVVGDGPAGLSGALFLAKNELRVVVFGGDQTAMHYAHLHNYLGIEEIHGSAYQEVARRQVESFGAELVDDVVEAVHTDEGAFRITTESGRVQRARYLVLAGSRRSVRLAQGIGAEVTGGGIVVDEHQRTDVDRCYAAGRAVRPHRSQAIVSAGAGAIAALDILSRETGDEFHDWDTPPEE